MLWLKKLLKIATPDEIELNNIRQETERLKSEIEDMQNIKSSMQSEISAIEYELKEKQAQVIEVDERLLLQEVSLYKPVYDFVNSDEYKNRIDQIREQQKNLIKTDEAATGYTDWTVNNDRKAGRKMVNDTKKLLLRAFNSECEHCIEKVKYNNFDTCKKRIETARRTISKLGKIMAIDITALSKCDAIYMLPGWTRSAGSMAEYKFAEATNKTILYKEEVIASGKC